MTRATLLVVEDDPDMLELIGWVLEHADLRVVTARDAHTALAVAHAEHPDVVIVDVGLPGASGLDLIRSFRAMHHTSRTPAIVLTGQDPFDVGRRATDLDVYAFVHKPVRPAVLLDTVESCLRNHRIVRSYTSAAVADPSLWMG